MSEKSDNFVVLSLLMTYLGLWDWLKYSAIINFLWLEQVIDINSGETLEGFSNEGELCLSGPSIMKGYLKNPEATANTIKDGWLHTGRLCRVCLISSICVWCCNHSLFTTICITITTNIKETLPLRWLTHLIPNIIKMVSDSL